MSSLSVGVVGASGYTGETLIRLLLRHAGCSLDAITSRQQAGLLLGTAVPAVRGLPGADLTFEDLDPEQAATLDIGSWFLALPHGVAAGYAQPLIRAGRQVIDLSADFRLGDPEVYATYYGQPHPDPDLLRSVPYVIPELATGTDWLRAPLLACPGCYPTSIQLALVPLLRQQLIDPDRIVINSASGVTGAGRKADPLYLFSDRAESMRPYGQPRHRHLSEIEEQLGEAAGRTIQVQFNPHLVPMRIGILSTITVPARADLQAVYTAWESTYADQPFVAVLPSGTFPDTQDVLGTNRCDLHAVHDPRTGNLIIHASIDNLMKGAAGQAVQLFNLSRGLPMTQGLC
ncbi:MAG: N-acetyl-gamma-glutamyl-phosphate reductase [Opitutales bacterium]